MVTHYDKVKALYECLDTIEDAPEGFYAALRAILDQLEASRWRPIEEAPQDKMLLGVDPDRMAWPDIYGWNGNTWMPIRCIIRLNEIGSSGRYVAPTHYIPLPSPPPPAARGE